MTTIHPLNDRVLGRLLEAATTTPSGLVLPMSNKSNYIEAEVIAVGTGRVLDDGSVLEMKVSVGQRVLVHRHHGEELPSVYGEGVFLFDSGNILAVVV